MVPDQAPIVVPAELQRDDLGHLFDMVATSDGGLVLAWFSGDGHVVAKLDADNVVLWEKVIVPGNPEHFVAETLVVADDGTIFVGGYTAGFVTTAETNAGGMDAVVGKLAANGDVLWMHQWGTSGTEMTTTLVVTGDGGVLASGPCLDQVPGSPAANRTGPFLARYAADGSRTWVRQHAPSVTDFVPDVEVDLDNIFLDGSGGGRVFTSISLLRKSFDADGFETARSDPPAPVSGPRAWGTLRRGPGDQLFGWTAVRDDISVPPQTTLAAFDLDGTLRWYRVGESESAVIDDIAGVVWTGEWLTPDLNDHIVVGTDGVYIATVYRNSYENGPIERPVYANVVAKYDFAGDRVWFQEFRLPNPQTQTYAGQFLQVSSDGHPILGLTDATGAPFIVRLSADDGTIVGG